MESLQASLDRWLGRATARAQRRALEPAIEEIGRVLEVGDGVARVAGLSSARRDELLELDGDGTRALAVVLERDRIGCVIVEGGERLGAGATARRTGRLVDVPVGPALLGRVVDPLGRALDGGPPLAPAARAPVERPAPGIVDRELVSEPLQTGITVVDAMFPIGRGQRELVIGDRSTGKTALVTDAIINQRRSDVLCVYVSVGQRTSDVRGVIDAVRAHGAPERCLFVVAGAEASPGARWLAPYAGMAMAEHLADAGRHVLVAIDDLTKHAAVHREIALLLGETPGREAYPADVFYAHARLLERAARLSKARGGGSITVLPVAETQAGNLSAYIPTNLISITDGQIVLDARLFRAGQKPAVDVGLSVSRVGGKAQDPALRALAHGLRLDYAQFLELEIFTRFGGLADERTRRIVAHGRRIRAALVQQRHQPLALEAELALLGALTHDGGGG
jgi:F-type H+-transporting ATPase subunit alpha